LNIYRVKKKPMIFFIIFTALYFIYFQNNSIVTTEYIYEIENIGKDFKNIRIVQLSDLHGKNFGNKQDKLIQRVMKANPDLIIFTGDLIDSNKYNDEYALILMAQLTTIAPVYFVTGNHEWWSGQYESLEKKLLTLGVHVLRNTSEDIVINSTSIHLMGIDDPVVAKGNYTDAIIAESIINKIMAESSESDLDILLSHRPELLDAYAKHNVHLVFSGHAHGGQVRLPFIDGLVAPNQGFFPQYTSGMYLKENTTMVVSRGLGNSVIPIRIFNRPEIVVVIIKNR